MKNVRGHADFKTLSRILDLHAGVDEESVAGAPEKQDTRRGVDKLTTVESDKPRGLRMVYESTGGEGQIPKARLARESREIHP